MLSFPVELLPKNSACFFGSFPIKIRSEDINDDIGISLGVCHIKKQKFDQLLTGRWRKKIQF